MTTVYNMSNGEQIEFSTDPIESLITAAIMADKRSLDISNQIVRDKYRQKIIVGKYSASIGDYCVRV